MRQNGGDIGIGEIAEKRRINIEYGLPVTKHHGAPALWLFITRETLAQL